MLGRLARRLPRQSHPNRGQALVELALVMPVLFGIVVVLFQFGILFVAYLSLIHATRDIGRFVAVHPDTPDGAPTQQIPPCSAPPPAGSLWDHVCTYDVASVIDKNRLQDKPLTSVPCSALNGTGHCAGRTTGSEITINMSYDASTLIFLPTNFRMGPWLQFAVPSSWSTITYDYSVMLEPH